MSGYVYILTNQSFKDNWVKIGKSSRPVNVRSKELDNTAVPLPFEIYAVMKTSKYNEAERQIHSLIDLVNPSIRIRKGREFFNVTPEIALNIFKKCALTLDDAEITVFDTQENRHPCIISPSTQTPRSSSCHARKAARLTFAMLNIPIGSELVFSEDLNVKAHTLNDDNMIILDDGTETTLSGGVVAIKRRFGTATKSEAYQGGNYWLHNGERLTSIRKRNEQEAQQKI